MPLFEEPSRKPLEPAPEATTFEYSLAVAKVGALAFPFLGSGIALFDLITTPLRGKRLNDWCEQLRLQLNELSQTVKGLTPESLAQSEEFNSAFAQAAQAAVRTHQEEKLEALRNVVLNTVLPGAPDENRRLVFLSLIDRLALAHLQILKKLDNPTNYQPWAQQATIQSERGPVEWVKQFVPELAREDAHFLRLLIDDLQRAGLSVMKGDDPYIPREWSWMPELGKQFLRFITAPGETK